MKEEYKGADVRYWEIPSWGELVKTLTHEQSSKLSEFRWDYFQALLERWENTQSL